MHLRSAFCSICTANCPLTCLGAGRSRSIQLWKACTQPMSICPHTLVLPVLLALQSKCTFLQLQLYMATYTALLGVAQAGRIRLDCITEHVVIHLRAAWNHAILGGFCLAHVAAASLSPCVSSPYVGSLGLLGQSKGRAASVMAAPANAAIMHAAATPAPLHLAELEQKFSHSTVVGVHCSQCTFFEGHCSQCTVARASQLSCPDDGAVAPPGTWSSLLLYWDSMASIGHTSSS